MRLLPPGPVRQGHQPGLGEEVIADVTDDYQTSGKLTDAEKAALRFTDALIHDPALFDDGARAALNAHFTPAQIDELGIGITLFLALAKALITLGLEPEQMERTVLPTPSAAAGEVVEKFTAFRTFAGSAAVIDPALLALVDWSVARSHGLPHSSGSVDEMRSASAFLEKLPFAHQFITDEEAFAVRDALGEAGFVGFVVAACLADATARLDQIIDQTPEALAA